MNKQAAQKLVAAYQGCFSSWAQGEGEADVLPPCEDVHVSSSGRVILPAHLDQLEVVNGIIARQLEKRACPMPVQMQLDVAVEEMFVNVCHYAYAALGKPGDCVVSYLCTDDPRAIAIALVDSGAPFDPLTRKDPTKPTSIQEAKIGGLGIFMTKKSVDDISYQRVNGKNFLVFAKGW